MKKTKQRKQKNENNVISRLASEYMCSTTIHGLGYVGADDKNFVEKAWWLVIFIMSAIACAYLICQTWIKWMENPVVIRISSAQTYISKIPFPQVTICPINRIQLSKYNFTRARLNYKNLTDNERKQFWAVSLMCEQHDVDIPSDETVNEDVYEHIIQASTTMKEILPVMLWKIDSISMEYPKMLELTQFTSILTEEGLCFTFNSLRHEDIYTNVVVKQNYQRFNFIRKAAWNIAEGYSPNILDVFYYPEMTGSSGVEAGLQLLLTSRAADREYKCGPRMSGYKIYIHNQAEPPRIKEQHILLAHNKYMAISVVPNVVTISKDLKHMAPRTRNCYFTPEKRLKYYAMYTQNNCRLECFANLTKARCDCLPFYLPSERGVRICGLAKVNCLNETRTVMFNYQMETKLDDGSEDWSKWYGILNECDCIPSCALLEYDTRISYTDFYFTNASIPLNFLQRTNKRMHKENGTDYTKLDIFFRDSYFLSKERGELFQHTDFVTNCGGLLGLCLGMSFLSLVEIVYFLTLRLYYKRKEQQSVHVRTIAVVSEEARTNASE